MYVINKKNFCISQAKEFVLVTKKRYLYIDCIQWHIHILTTLTTNIPLFFLIVLQYYT